MKLDANGRDLVQIGAKIIETSYIPMEMKLRGNQDKDARFHNISSRG